MTKLTMRAVSQVRVADRVISLTDTGNIQKRDSLLMAAVKMNFPKGDESEDDDKSPVLGNRPLSTIEVLQEMVLGTVVQNASLPDDTRANTSTTAVYRYYVKFSGRLKFLIFLILCAIFVFGMTFNR